MRRLLFAAGWFVAGMLALPVLSLCVSRATARNYDAAPNEASVDEDDTCVAIGFEQHGSFLPSDASVANDESSAGRDRQRSQ